MSTAGGCSGTGCDDSTPPPNPDLEGIAVSVANVVTTICLRILITWSPGDVDVGVQASFLQIYSILLSTLLSINRQQLALEDVSFAFNLISSPLMAYLVAASIGDLYRSKTGLYKRIKSRRRTIRLLGALILPLWLALTMVFTFSDSAFTDSFQEGVTSNGFSEWLLFIIMTFFNDVLEPGPFFPLANNAIIGAFIVLFLYRNWSQLVVEVRPCLNSKPFGWFRLPLMFIKSAWCNIDRNHKWFVYLVFAYIDFGWAASIISDAIFSYSGGYILSYGQVLSVFSAIPPFLLTVEFLYSSCWDLLRFAQSFPRRFRVEVVFLFTGKKPDHLIRDPDHLPLASISSVPREGSNGPPASPPEESRQAENPISPPDNPQDVSTSQDTEEHETANAARVSIHDATGNIVEEGAGSSRSISGHEYDGLDGFVERPDGAGSCGYVADGTQHVELNDGPHGSPPEESLQAEDPTTLPDGSHDDVTGEDVPPT